MSQCCFEVRLVAPPRFVEMPETRLPNGALKTTWTSLVECYPNGLLQLDSNDILVKIHDRVAVPSLGDPNEDIFFICATVHNGKKLVKGLIFDKATWMYHLAKDRPCMTIVEGLHGDLHCKGFSDAVYKVADCNVY